MSKIYNLLNYEEPEVKWYAKPSMPLAKVLIIETHENGVYLYHYAKNGEFAGDTLHETIEEAKEQAEFAYGDALTNWQPFPEKESDPLAYILKDKYTFIRYPDKGYMVILFIINNGELANIHPLFTMFNSVDEASLYIQGMLQDLKQKGENVEVADIASLLSLKLLTNIILEKGYLEKHNERLSSSQRSSLFIPLIKKSIFHKILVMQDKDDKDQTKIITPLELGYDLDKALRSISFNGIKLDNKDKEAGLYDIESFKKLYWKTGIIEEL